VLALAQDAVVLSPVDAASRAESALSRYCADIVSLDTTGAVDAMAAVSSTTGDVSRAYEASKEPFLLYWRGALQHCLGLEDRARDDLAAFLDGAGDEPAYVELAKDAQRRLRRIGGTAAARTSSGPPPGAIGFGVGLAAASAGTAGLAAWRAGVLAERDGVYHSGTLAPEDYAGVAAEATAAGQQANALTVAAVACGVGSTVALVAGALAGDTSKRAAVVVVPGPSGLAVAIGGSW
jgi:hypothetical protein